MITAMMQSALKYWGDVLASGYQLYTDTKTELAKANPDAGKLVVAAVDASVRQVENYWQTWGDMLNPAAATVVLSLDAANVQKSNTVSTFPMIGLGALVPDTNGVPLVALRGNGSGTLKAEEATFDRVKVTVDNLKNLTVGDVYFGVVYRVVNNNKTRPIANVFARVVT